MLKDLEKKIEIKKTELESHDPIMLMSKAAAEKEKTFKFERYSTGMIPIDSVTKLRPQDKGGLTGGDVVIVAAPTGNGKTTFCATLSYNMLRAEGLPSLWFSYEVNVWNLWQIFKNFGVNEEELVCVPFEHTTGNLDWIRRKIAEAKEKFFVKLVVIDHLGFLTPSQRLNSNMGSNYAIYLAQIVRELKTIAVQEDIIILLPVHMVKSAGDDPTLRDIGHSGGIAQEADLVILLAREENTKSKMVGIANENYYSRYAKVMIAKNRIGGETPSWWVERKDGLLVQTIKTNDNVSENFK